jgi:vacuolar-type H+-ATPase subunit E/Vma4
MANKGNVRKMAEKNMELARQREMKKLKEEVKKMTISDAQRILRRMVRQAKMSP